MTGNVRTSRNGTGDGTYNPYPGGEIIVGDALEHLRAMDTGSAPCIFTSPPYNKGWRFDYRSGWEGIVNKSSRSTRFRDGYDEPGDDGRPMGEYLAWLAEVVAECRRVASGGVIFWNMKPRLWVDGLWTPLDLFPRTEVRQILIWNTTLGISVNRRSWAQMAEWVLVASDADFSIALPESARGDVWTIPPDVRNPHPAPFPVELPKRALASLDPRPTSVVDPFAGSGSTLRAAKDLGIPGLGIERSQKWADYAVQRMAQGVLTI